MIDFKKAEDEVLDFWAKNKIYEKVKKKNSKGKKFYFLQGPPYTSGKLHIGHAWNNSLKDMILRYKRMKGFNVWDRGGFDMHGLPTEHKVQKKLGLKTKDDILEYGMDKFVKECMNFSIEHANYMNDDLKRLGVWMDHENAYKPIEKEFISGQWKFFKEADKQKRLYKGKKVMHWDAATETALAKHDLEYKKVKDNSVFLKFKKKNSKNEYYIIWTTTPWTIPFNLAIMVNPEIEYLKVEVDGENWIIAEDLAESFISETLKKDFKILEKFKGKKLEGEEYEPPFYQELKKEYDFLKKENNKIHTIILNKNYVDTSAGTGLVHCAPGCGPEDHEAASAYGIEPFNTINERGEFEDLGKFSGWKAKKDDKKFIEEFENNEILVAKKTVEHDYPHSDRSKEPVIFRTTDQWFLKTEDLIPKILKFSDKTNWVPPKVKNSYDRWTENLKDNGLTRQRFWGCPVPIWVNGDDYIVVGSSEELEKLTGKKFDSLTLHKPWIDKITIEKNGKKYERIPDVADVWIDSGTTSWNCLYNDPKLIKEWFPADLVLEATEMTRLWFSMLEICSAIMFKESCFKNVFAHGMILDFQGMKMSKSLGNIISPYEVIEKYSVDILRYYMCQVSAGENISFNWEDVKAKQKNLIVLLNIANYVNMLESQQIPKGKEEIEEKWILSKYNSSLQKVSELFENYRLDETITEIESLFITLSRDYIKFIRDKASENFSVLKTLKEIFIGILKMFSTICPFLTENIWQKMSQKEQSVHLSEWPKADNKKIDENLEKEFTIALEVIEAGLRERDKEKIGLKWPLAKATITLEGSLSGDLKEIVARQLNVKKVEVKKGKEKSVVLDTKITPELEAEGYSREVARRVQATRKNRGLNKEDRINLKIMAEDKLKIMLEKNLEFLKERTGSDEIKFVSDESSKMEKFEVREFSVGIDF